MYTKIATKKWHKECQSRLKPPKQQKAQRTNKTDPPKYEGCQPERIRNQNLDKTRSLQQRTPVKQKPTRTRSKGGRSHSPCYWLKNRIGFSRQTEKAQEFITVLPRKCFQAKIILM